MRRACLDICAPAAADDGDEALAEVPEHLGLLRSAAPHSATAGTE
jgi:DNA-binding transcriptional MocR family regulator